MSATCAAAQSVRTSHVSQEVQVSKEGQAACVHETDGDAVISGSL